VDLGLLGSNAHLLAAAPGDGADIKIAPAHGLDDLGLALLDRVDRIGDLVAEELGRAVQPLGMLARLEDLAAIGALALEGGGGIVQGVGQDVELGIAPRD
jgi:hypothetical protein